MPLLLNPGRSIEPKTTLTKTEASHIRSLSLLRGLRNGSDLRLFLSLHDIHIEDDLDLVPRTMYPALVLALTVSK